MKNAGRNHRRLLDRDAFGANSVQIGFVISQLLDVLQAVTVAKNIVSDMSTWSDSKYGFRSLKIRRRLSMALSNPAVGPASAPPDAAAGDPTRTVGHFILNRAGIQHGPRFLR